MSSYGNKFTKDDLLSRLSVLDGLLVGVSPRPKFIVIGGSAMSILAKPELKMRTTTDVDLLGKIPVEFIDLAEDLGINNKAENVFTLPDVSELELTHLTEFKNMDLYVVSWLDLAIIKFYTERDKDLEDLYRFILPNLDSYDELFKRLDYHRADYIFNINNINLNLNHKERIFQSLFEVNKIAVPLPNQSFEEFLDLYDTEKVVYNELSSRVNAVESYGVEFLKFEDFLSMTALTALVEYGLDALVEYCLNCKVKY